MSPTNTPEIFVSYAWEADSEKIVDKFEGACKQRGYKLVRDKTDLQFKGLITEFMKKIGRGKYVLVVLSEKYLKSSNCMFELSEIVKNGDFYDRIFPIITDSANIFKAIGIVRYVKYWEEQIAELDEAMIGLRSQADLAGIREEIDRFTSIRATISNLTNTLRDMNSLSVQQHITANFEDVFTLIDKDSNPNEEEESLPEITVEPSENTTAVKKKSDRIIANLLKVSHPKQVYLANLSFDRQEVIKQSWETDFKLKNNSSERKVAISILKASKKPFQKEFIVNNHKLISFNDPTIKKQGLSQLIDPGTVEKYSIDEFLLIKPENKNLLVNLLRICLNEKLRLKEIEWIKTESCFRFKMGIIPKTKKITWKDIKTATRTVIFERYNKDKTQILCFKHLAFKVDFILLDSGIYIAINPTWSITKDGKFEYAFASDEISGQKRLENNQAVNNHFRFLQYCLTKSIVEGDEYNLVSLAEIENFDNV